MNNSLSMCIAVYHFLNFYGSISTRHKDLMNCTIALETIPTHVPYRWTRIAILIFLLMKSTFVFIYLLSSCRENCRLKNYFKDAISLALTERKTVYYFLSVLLREHHCLYWSDCGCIESVGLTILSQFQIKFMSYHTKTPIIIKQ